MTPRFSLFDVVEFACDLPSQRIKRGEQGTILEFLNADTVLIELADDRREGLEKIVESQLAHLNLVKTFEDVGKETRSLPDATRKSPKEG